MLSKKLILKRILPLLVGLVFLGAGGIFLLDVVKGGASGDGTTKYELIISPGDSSTKITKDLTKHGILKSTSYFTYLLKFTGNTNRIKQGVYLVDNGMSARKIMDILVEGKVKMISFTIPEGYNNRQIGDLLTKKDIAKSKEEFLKVASSPEILSKYKIPAKTTEGYLFPETYVIPYNYPLDRIVEMMLKRFFLNLQKVDKANGISPEELHKKVILASIVEREAKKKEERPLMAGVFIRRLKKNIALESCATVQYLFDKPKKRLFEKDLLIPSDYNTYLHKGYPPGPISNPGMPAILAAFNPEETENLFFLLKPDGYHYFSKDHREHAQAKKKYIDVLYE
ncbi:MAG: endolytic transglycosylase MltG [Leptospiraceae bacterium]|nr:endolytic transglycosylase MltG [Leptospiraceae bacterium]